MNRRFVSVLGAVAVAGAMPALLGQAPAQAMTAAKEPIKQARETTAVAKEDSLPDAQADRRNALRQRAVDQLVAGRATYAGKGKNRTIKLKDGTKVDYPVNQTAQLLTFLVDFGDGEGNSAFPDNTAGPVHNQLPDPKAVDPSDNSTYWVDDFSREHYLDMFFNGLPEQDGESFHDVYSEMSSGRFDLEGDVSDWVSVPHPESYYQDATGDESGTAMTNYIQDTGDAWYDAQVAAGKSEAEIKDYLATFDVWDRYDYDGDGDYNEPDGYIDHFQAIHAGGGEEAGNDPWTIWSHRWAVNQSQGVDGPAFNRNGGVEIGDTGYYIRDYTTEPEDGGLGVFSHEFGHDLGLPDYYDTNGGDNSTAFWTLMSSGSWMGHGDGSIGSTPDQMDAEAKLFLGWYGEDDLAVVDGTKDPEDIVLGPSYHATTTGAQAVAVTLPKGEARVDVVEPQNGQKYFYSGNGDDRNAYLTSPTVTVPAEDPTLTAKVNYSIEDDWDYAYLEVKPTGSDTWTHVATNLSTTTDPNHQNAGYGITYDSGGQWVDLSADLAAYAGQDVQVRFEMFNDAGYHELGFSVDDIALGGTLLTDVEDGAGAWTLDGYRVIDGNGYTTEFDQYYLAENRQYDGYDKTLAEGPYSFDYPNSAPNKVDQFPYQDGLLVWYVSTLESDNNTSGHAGTGAALPVDANPAYSLWTIGGKPAYYASGRLEAYDATFDVDETDGLHLEHETYGNYDVDAHPSVPVFEDSDPDAYMDNTYARSSWYSTRVAGVGTEIQVLSSDETTGKMVVKAGKRFVAATTAGSVSGKAVPGNTVTAHAPTYFQDGVSVGYQWLKGGRPIAGATDASYRVKPGEAKSLSVEITGTKDGYGSSVVTVSAG